jgi:hypothetical protein
MLVMGSKFSTMIASVTTGEENARRGAVATAGGRANAANAERATAACGATRGSKNKKLDEIWNE